MPIVSIVIRKGRSDAQKAAMFEQVTDAILRTLEVPLDSIRIVLTEKEPQDMAVGGKRRLPETQQ